MKHRRGVNGEQRTVHITRNPNGTHDVFLLMAFTGEVILQKLIRHPRPQFYGPRKKS